MNFKNKPENWFLAIILLIAALLRFYKLDFSFTNDELSAISRLNFDTFKDLIQRGVKVDGHPAFTQVFLYYWTAWFGNTEWVVRLPFALWGVGSVFFAYKVSKSWFGAYPALLTAGAMAVLEYFILYSQLARPYSPGLFFTLWAMWHWTQLIENRGQLFHAILGGIAVGLAMLTHYFSFMQVVLMAGVGLFFLPRNQFKNYSVGAIVALLFWLPHAGITLYQVGVGNVGGWLGPPEFDFPIRFLLVVFNDSLFPLLLSVFTVSILSIVGIRAIQLQRWHVISLSLIILPLSIGFAYSRFVSPVLQYSTLLFAAPLILFLLFSIVPKTIAFKHFSVAALGMIFLIFFNTAFTNQFYNKEHFSVFRQLAQKLKEWDLEYGSREITRATHLNSITYLEHYLNKSDHRAKFAIVRLDSDSSMHALNKIVHSKTTPYFAFFWSSGHVPFETEEIIRLTYPQLIDQEIHLNSGAKLFSSSGKDERQSLLDLCIIDEPHSEWVHNLNPDQLDVHSSIPQYKLLSNDEYSPSISFPLNHTMKSNGEQIVAQVSLNCEENTEITLVCELQLQNGEKVWAGSDLHPIFAINPDSLHNLIISRPLTGYEAEVDRAVVYLWKRSEKPVNISSFRIRVY